MQQKKDQRSRGRQGPPKRAREEEEPASSGSDWSGSEDEMEAEAAKEAAALRAAARRAMDRDRQGTGPAGAAQSDSDTGSGSSEGDEALEASSSDGGSSDEDPGSGEDGAGPSSSSDGDGDGTGSSSDDEDEDAAAEGQEGDPLEDVPFEQRLLQRVDGAGPSAVAARKAAAAAKAKEKEGSFKRANRHRPSEASSKRPVSRFREVVQAPKREGRDPRFDAALGGPANRDAFRKRYRFLYDEVLPQERRELRDRVKVERDPSAKRELQAQLTRVEQALKGEQEQRKKAKLEEEWKAKERDAVKAGKKPFYLKASEKKRLQLIAKYEELKEGGKLDKYMEKRRKKNANKDHRYMPSKRRTGGQD